MPITLPTVPPFYSSPRLEYSVAQKLQVALQTKLGWLDRAYHIAKVGINAEGKSTYPQIYANDGTKNHHDIRPDSEIAAYCFFEVDKATRTNKNEDEITCFFSVVFWCNLDLIDPALTHDFSSQLMQDARDVLEYYEAVDVDVETRPEKIFDKYSGLTQELKQHLMRRYSAFKISFEITDSYTDICNPDDINVCQMNIDRINNLPTATKDCVIAGLGGGEPATVENSDQSFQEQISPGDTLVLPDQELDVFLDGVLVDTVTYPAMTEPNIDIQWQ